MFRKTIRHAVLLTVLMYVPLRGADAATVHNFQYVDGATLTRAYRQARHRLGPDADKAQLFAAMLGLDKHMRLVLKSSRTFRGVMHDEFAETYRDIPIYHFGVTVFQGPIGQIVGVGGETVDGLDKDIQSTTARITPDDALHRAESAWARKVHGTPTFDDASVIIRIYIDSNNNGHLAYLVQFSAWTTENSFHSAPFAAVDAISGDVLHIHDGAVS